MRDIDAIIQQLRLIQPGLSAEQLTVSHPGADDDGLWLFRHPSSGAEIQLESATGNAPFLVESSASVNRLVAGTVREAIALVVAGLGLSSPTA